MIDQLEIWDKALFKFLNGLHNSFFDFLMPGISNKYIWIPLYLLILYYLIRRSGFKTLYIIIGIGLLIFLSDQSASGILKPWVERLRPCYDPTLEGQVHLLKGCGGKYGFASSHASNSFAVAMFAWLMLKDHIKFIWLLFPWAILVAYSRVYIGVHFPGDIMVGAILGILSAYLVAYFIRIISKKV
ncbi:MAG TPA: phosphatase PAP2 family protein [Roseivirga sp.]